jgi:hypothetical protein
MDHRISRNVPRREIDRASCAWRDAIGPGFVTGVNDQLLKAVASAGASGYCR